MISPKRSEKETKYITSTDKYEVEGSFNLKTLRNNIMYTFLYSDISEFSGNLQ